MAKRTKHSLSHYRLLTAEMGQLIPINVEETLPNDTFQAESKAVIRLSPQAAPVYHDVTARIHHFWVANRNSWSPDSDPDSNWEEFITGGRDGFNTDVVPKISSTGVANDLLDYMGVAQVAGIDINALPIMAFNDIFNEYYRDQDLVPERSALDTSIPQISWEKDYFSTARPWTQKGAEISLPVGGDIPISGIGTATGAFATANQTVTESNGEEVEYPFAGSDTTGNYFFRGSDSSNGIPEIFANMGDASTVSVNDFREAFALQRFAEARAKYGSRYTEYLRYLGSNYRGGLDRPVYLGGGEAKIQFSEVLQTAPEIQQEQQREYGVGDMYGHGVGALKSNKYRRTFDEHGYVISLLSLRPKAVYTSGIDRHWLRETNEDYFQKELELIGQQEVFNNEIYASTESGTETFGFQDRYQEYRHTRSGVSAEFRNILNYWHMGREFTDTPLLNQSFIDCVPTKRIYNEQTQHPLWINIWNSVVARRIVGKSGAMSRII